MNSLLLYISTILLHSVRISRGSISKSFFFLFFFFKNFWLSQQCHNRSFPCVISFKKMYTFMALSSVLYEIWNIISKLLSRELQWSVVILIWTIFKVVMCLDTTQGCVKFKVSASFDATLSYELQRKYRCWKSFYCYLYYGYLYSYISNEPIS